MISPEIIHVNYIKKEAQTGSYCGMRYRLSKGKNEEGDCNCNESKNWRNPSVCSISNI